MTLLSQLHGALLLVLRYFCDMLHLAQLYELAFAAFMRVVEHDVVPDSILRRGMRLLLRKRLADVRITPTSALLERSQSPLAHEQHMRFEETACRRVAQQLHLPSPRLRADHVQRP